jgi:hypothetical protein
VPSRSTTPPWLFEIGVVESGYKFNRGKRDFGDADDAERFYSHYRDVKWLKTEYMPHNSLVLEGETPWQPYRTLGKFDA